MKQMFESRKIVGMKVNASNYDAVSNHIIDLAKKRKSSYVCVANVHMCMEAHDDKSFQNIVNNAELVTSDGMPLVLGLKLLGCSDAERVYGPDLTLNLCEASERENVSVALYGGTEESLLDFEKVLNRRYPSLKIVCKIAPPFRPLTEDEDKSYIQEINESGAQLLFVGIGCPRQEKWMAAHQNKINAVMLGVGAAFDFHSGRVKQSPSWMQKLSLEWFFRLLMEPKRLWKRYLYHNPRFVYYFVVQFMKFKIRF